MSVRGPLHARKGRIGVLPVGPVPGPVLDTVAGQVRARLGLEGSVLPALENPVYALDKKRDQYNAATIINHVESLDYPACDKVIGIVNADLYVPIFTHVLGQAREGGKFGVVSLYRLTRQADRSTAPAALILDRVTKIAMHELGHLFELVHCLDEACLMRFSGDVGEIDRLDARFCGYCMDFMADALRRRGLA